jgi:hypothetical protein
LSYFASAGNAPILTQCFECFRRVSTKCSPTFWKPVPQAREFVREEMHHVREEKHAARSPQQAIAIGLSKARRAGVKLGASIRSRLRSKARFERRQPRMSRPARTHAAKPRSYAPAGSSAAGPVGSSAGRGGALGRRNNRRSRPANACCVSSMTCCRQKRLPAG